MSAPTSITLGGVSYPLGNLRTMRWVSRFAPLFSAWPLDWTTLPGTQAITSIIHLGLQSGGYTGSMDSMLDLPASRDEMAVAATYIGIAVGHLTPRGADAAPGEGLGAVSP